MSPHLKNLLVTFMAVLLALFVYDRFKSWRAESTGPLKEAIEALIRWTRRTRHSLFAEQNLTKRHVDDKILAEEAQKRITAKDSTLGERAAATAV